MFRHMRLFVPVLALGFIAVMSYAVHADDAAKPDQATGTISGKVVNKDNSAVADATIKLFPAPAKHHKKDKAAPNANEKKARPAPVAETKSDAEGNFTLPNVPVGNYRLIAGLKGVGAGRVEVEVKAGETANVTVTLEKHEPRKPKQD